MDLLRYIGNRIRELRQAYGGEGGLSQEALAKHLDVTPNTVSRWETATYKPDINDLEKLSRFFGVSILELFPRLEAGENEPMAALLRTARDLPDDDIRELQKYAEFRKARSIYSRPQPGRKPKVS
ncbi:MAG: helix-turn-helix transcriptional regulator [Elusimicrobia bacterium]|nr:helix-turn-helix transcriptional regulator [Elusimicrobiota bacterium]